MACAVTDTRELETARPVPAVKSLLPGVILAGRGAGLWQGFVWRQTRVIGREGGRAAEVPAERGPARIGCAPEDLKRSC